MNEHGPFSSERQAMSTPAGARIRAAYDARPGTGASIPARVLVMTDACAECGVDIGALDLITLKGIAWRETYETVCVAGMIRRAFKAGKAAGPGGSEPLTASPEVRCAGVDDDPDDGGAGAFDCGDLSRFVIWRSDGDLSYGINGGSEEACERHLAGAVHGMIDGDVSVRAVVAVRWDAPPDRECRHCGGPIRRCTSSCAAAPDYPLCKGWRHVGYDDQPVIGHCCEGRSINPAAEPREGSGNA